MNTKKEPWLLLGIAAASIIIWQLPGGGYVIYPFTILSTWFHEMAHGLMAVVLGGRFLQLEIYANGSGLAVFSLPVSHANLTLGLVAFAGPIGPTLAGALFLVISPYPKASRILLVVLGVILLLSTLIWVRSLYGLVAIPLIAAAILAIAFKCKESVSHFTVNLLGIQAMISLYQDAGYFFTESVTIQGQTMLSDTGKMAQAFWLPHWFWAIAIILFSLVVLFLSFRWAYLLPRRTERIGTSSSLR